MSRVEDYIMSSVSKHEKLYSSATSRLSKTIHYQPVATQTNPEKKNAMGKGIQRDTNYYGIVWRTTKRVVSKSRLEFEKLRWFLGCGIQSAQTFRTRTYSSYRSMRLLGMSKQCCCGSPTFARSM